MKALAHQRKGFFMAEAAMSPEFQTNIIPIDERVLTEVDNILMYRNPDGSIDDTYLKDFLANLVPAVQEAAMPFAVTTTRHEFEHDLETGQKTFKWLGKTAVQAAMSGYRYHTLPAARARVDVEVDEARYATDPLDPGKAKIFISPKMTRYDATLTEARQEHLGDEDSVRISWLETDENGSIKNRVMQSLLVRDIPYEAWIKMLKDENNIFGRSIDVIDDGSALSVMKVHRELELPVEVLKGGPISVVEAVIPYIEDAGLRNSVIDQTKLFYGDQEAMRRTAEMKAEQWLDFEISLAESLYNERANFDIERFIITLQDFWSHKDLMVIKNHELDDGGYKMSRRLAVILEKAKQNTLWGGAASTVANPHVTSQMKPEVVATIQQNEALIQLARQNGMDYYFLEAENNRLIASQNIKVGGGCPGESKDIFGRNDLDPSNSLVNDLAKDNRQNEKENWKWKQGICRVKSCGKKTEVGPCDVCRSCQSKYDKGEDPNEGRSAKIEEPSEEKKLNKFQEILNISLEDELEIELQQIIEEESLLHAKELEVVG